MSVEDIKHCVGKSKYLKRFGFNKTKTTNPSTQNKMKETPPKSGWSHVAVEIPFLLDLIEIWKQSHLTTQKAFGKKEWINSGLNER